MGSDRREINHIKAKPIPNYPALVLLDLMIFSCRKSVHLRFRDQDWTRRVGHVDAAVVRQKLFPMRKAEDGLNKRPERDIAVSNLNSAIRADEIC